MAASVIEQILSQVHAVLSASIAATVERGLEDAFDADDMPAINIRRGGSSHELYGAGVQRLTVAWSIEFFARGEDWESQVDALHAAAHVALAADSTLSRLGAGLLCVSTDPSVESADQLIGRLSAQYQMQVLSHVGDIARRIR